MNIRRNMVQGASVCCALLLGIGMAACGKQKDFVVETETTTTTEALTETESETVSESVIESLSETETETEESMENEYESIDTEDELSKEAYIESLKAEAKPEEEWSRPYYEKVKELSDKRIAERFNDASPEDISPFMREHMYGDFRLIDWAEGKPPVLFFEGEGPSGDSTQEYAFIYANGEVWTLVGGDAMMNHNIACLIPDFSLFVDHSWFDGVNNFYYLSSLKTGKPIALIEKGYDKSEGDFYTRCYIFSEDAKVDNPLEIAKQYYGQKDKEPYAKEIDEETFIHYLKDTTGLEIQEEEINTYLERIFQVFYPYEGKNEESEMIPLIPLGQGEEGWITANYAKPALLGEDPD